MNHLINAWQTKSESVSENWSGSTQFPGRPLAGRQEVRPMSCLIPEAELRDQLLRENVEYRRLAAEHQSCDDQLEGLTNKHFLNEDEQVQERTLKKKKLLLKDQMYSIVQKIRKQMEADSRQASGGK